MPSGGGLNGTCIYIKEQGDIRAVWRGRWIGGRQAPLQRNGLPKFSSLGPWGGGPEVKEEEQALIFIPEPVRKSLSRKEGVKVLRTTSYVTNKHLRSAQPRADLRSTNENHHDMPSHTLQLRPNRDGRDTAAREDLQRTAGSQVRSRAGASTPQSKPESRALHTSPRGHTVTQ